MSKFLWVFYLLLTFLITLPMGWWLLAKADFAYPVLYEPIGVAEHIERYAPKNNQNKPDFELTSKEDRLKLFHQVVVSIHHQGKGLAEISYQNKNRQTVPLFTSAEVIHLQDVANLLDKLKPLLIGLVILWLSASLILFLKKIRFPGPKQWLISTALIAAIVVIILALGPEKIFNQLHVWVFPGNHQWFFYYEESLMSTMMKAPDLFGFIAAIWGVLSIFLTFVLLFLMHQFSGNKRAK